MRRFTLVIGSVFLVAGCVQTPPGPGEYPDGEIKLIVPFEAGENADTAARAFAPCLGDRLGTDVIVENRPGEEGVLATREFLEERWDAHTFLVSTVNPAVVAPVLTETGYTISDFRFLGVPYSAPLILFTAGNSPMDTAEKVLTAARAGGAPVTVANPGDSTIEGFALWHLNRLAKTDLESAPLDSDAEILRGVVAGDYTAGLATLSPDHLTRIESGEITVLAVGGHGPSEYLPDVPSLYEITGAFSPGTMPDMPELVLDTAIIAPNGLFDHIAQTMSATLDECLSTDEVRRGVGADFVPAEQVTPGELTRRYFTMQAGVTQAQNMAATEGR